MRENKLMPCGSLQVHLPETQHQVILNQLKVARPSLAAIHGKYVPIIRNIPLAVRRLWAQCLKQSLAQVVWSNSEVSWVELQMLAKCTLCRPARGGKRHKSQRLAWTRSRLQRWLAGERLNCGMICQIIIEQNRRMSQ